MALTFLLPEIKAFNTVNNTLKNPLELYGIITMKITFRKYQAVFRSKKSFYSPNLKEVLQKLLKY